MRKVNKVFNLKFVLNSFGSLLLIEAFFMAITAIVPLLYGENDAMTFVWSALITAAVGLMMRLYGRGYSDEIQKREAFVIVALTWVCFSAFGQLPFLLSHSIPNVTDAFFETMSGFSTTGASILNNIEELSHGVLFWRSLIQWLGGMGIIVLTLALLPRMGVHGGVFLFNSESSGLTHDKLRPKIHQTARRLWGIYIALTAVLIALLWVGPMNLYDSICHAFTAMATGGFSTKQASVAYWDSAYVDYILSVFMIIAGINFALLYFFFKGQRKRVFLDEELRWYLAIIGLSTVIITGMLLYKGIYPTVSEALRFAFFQVSSIMTTTGFATADYVMWGPFFCMIMFVLMFFGGSAGSTSGGLKIIRLVLLSKNMVNEFGRQIHPNAIYPVRVNGQAVNFDLVTKVLAFLFMYVMILFICSIILTAFGSTFDEAMGAVVTCINGVGPGLGRNGPAGSFSEMHAVSKWLLSFVMLIGRLELFTVLILFFPAFWKK